MISVDTPLFLRQVALEHGLHGRRSLRRSKGQGLQRDGRLQPRGTRHGRGP